MAGGKPVQSTKFAISQFLVEAGRLKTERVEVDAPHAALARFRFRGFHESLAPSLATLPLGGPEQADEQPAEKSFADESADDLAPIAQRDRQRTVVGLARRVDVVSMETFENLPLGRTVHTIDVQRHHRGMFSSARR